jgi:beta-aspartyl-peptidase (threonine type)
MTGADHIIYQETCMNGDSDKGAVVVAVGLILILLLLIGGAAAYFLVGRQRMALEQAEIARMAEAQAKMQAQQALAEANAATLSPTPSENEETSAGDGDSIGAAVESVLRAQADAWNRGDLEAFMEHYWKSESLTFSSGGKTARGWTETLNRYRERYPTPEKMGRLKFSGLETMPLGNSAALVLGQWTLEREDEPLSGSFSLVVRKLDDRWLIIHDHTSRLMD